MAKDNDHNIFAPETEPIFNLIDEKWIKVVGNSGVELVSLREILVNSDQYSMISGELPLQDFAIMRLLIAVTRSAIKNYYYDDNNMDNGLLTEELWVKLWNDKEQFDAVISDYFDDEFIYDSFYLFHPKKPFYQVGNMESLLGETDSIEAIILDAPTSQALMTFKSSEAYKNGLDYDEAARWLITVMGYDKCGAHKGVIGDNRVATTGGGKNRSYPKKPNLALITGVQLNGVNLFETVMLNTVPIPDVERESFVLDNPLWEIDSPLSPGALYEVDNERTKPYGVLQLLTWPSRRVRMFRDGNKVISCIVTNGDALDPTDTNNLETMASYRIKEEKGEKSIVPYVQDKNKAFWRGLETLFSASPKYIPARNVDFLASLKANKVINRNDVRISIFSAKYDVAMSSSLTDVVHEITPIPLEVLSSQQYQKYIIGALDTIDTMGSAYWRYLRNCSLAISPDEEIAKKAANKGIINYYHNAQKVFNSWLFQLQTMTGNPYDELMENYDKMIRDMVTDYENKIHDSRYIIGRQVDGKNYSLNTAKNILFGTLKKINRGINNTDSNEESDI